VRYISTRGGTPPLSFKDAVIEGQAPDGGLLLPERIPDVRAVLDDWRGLPFAALAVQVISLFVDDIPATELSELVSRSYASFDHPDVTPLVPVGDCHVLELFHGPTLAFKDVALQFLGNAFEMILRDRGSSLNILGATSGDTGSAAIAGVRGKAGLSVFVLFPDGRTSALQELQMTSVLDENVHCIAIEGSFDDCQGIMKSVFNDLHFKQRYRLGAVNSVNWARILAQIVYYAYAALRLDERGQRKVSFSVPTGNFGDIFAGYLALRMGLPIDRLVLATNENDILASFFRTGIYRRGSVHHTISPSMDIQVASNFERYVYLRLGSDSERLRSFMDTFTRTGEARLAFQSPLERDIVAGSAGTEETLATIREVHARTGYLVDPHTAVGIAVGRRLVTDRPLVCLATAHPAKFPESVDKAVGRAVASHPRLDALRGCETRKTVLPASVDAVKAFVAQHAI
jgi:threonine synthase